MLSQRTTFARGEKGSLEKAYALASSFSINRTSSWVCWFTESNSCCSALMALCSCFAFSSSNYTRLLFAGQRCGLSWGCLPSAYHLLTISLFFAPFTFPLSLSRPIPTLYFLLDFGSAVRFLDALSQRCHTWEVIQVTMGENYSGKFVVLFVNTLHQHVQPLCEGFFQQFLTLLNDMFDIV